MTEVERLVEAIKYNEESGEFGFAGALRIKLVSAITGEKLNWDAVIDAAISSHPTCTPAQLAVHVSVGGKLGDAARDELLRRKAAGIRLDFGPPADGNDDAE